jgi:hypothetical protein
VRSEIARIPCLLKGVLRLADGTGPRTVAYLGFGRSHAETLAHLRENGRVTLKGCAFSGPPTVVRIRQTRVLGSGGAAKQDQPAAEPDEEQVEGDG